MYFEHVAMNVPDPTAMADWYVRHCGLRSVQSKNDAPYTQFLADSTGRIMLEIYENSSAPIPDYASQDPLVLHIAFAVNGIESAKSHILGAGATLVSQQQMANGTVIVMLRDPWGLALQLVQRGAPLGT